MMRRDLAAEELLAAYSVGLFPMADEKGELKYLPMPKLPKHLDKIPSGTVVTIIRQDNPKIPVLVSHQGFLVRKRGKPYFRHAAFSDKVVDVPFLEYFYKYFSSGWRVVGLHLASPASPEASPASTAGR